MARKLWINNKNIVISGASSGIGFEMAKIFAGKYNCNIIGIGRNIEKLEKAQNQIEEAIKTAQKPKKAKESTSIGSFKYVVFDVSNQENWNDFKNQLDKENFKVDILINNAGIMLPFENFDSQDIESAKKVFETNFYSHLYSYKTFVETLEERKGAIISISSSSALCPVVGTAIYGASKAAIKSFTETIGIEKKGKIYIACVCPGFAKTDLFREGKELSGLVKKFSMPAQKMARKIVRAIIRKRRRIVIGSDAHAMSGFYRMLPKTALGTITSVLKNSKDPMFDKVFPENIEKRKK